ncbi:F-box protein-like protein [Tanacetum coccineum]
MKKITRRGSRKKENVDHFALLPDDVVVLILRKLPVDELRFRVCYNNSGSPRHRVVRITEEEGELAVKEQDLEIPYKGCIKSWVDEYLLISGHSKKGSLYLYNILTKEGLFLPRCSLSCGGHYGRKCGVGFSYDRFKQVYKVVHVFNGPPIQSELIILKPGNFNSSTWKKINGPLYTGQRKYSWHDPVSIDGRYLHWNVNSFDYLLSMDTVEERFRRISLPPIYDDNLKNKNQYSICKMGGFLGLHEVSSENDVMWVLKNFERTTWEKLKFIGVTASVDPDRGILIPPIAPRITDAKRVGFCIHDSHTIAQVVQWAGPVG